MDFCQIIEKKHPRKETIEVYPDFMVRPSKDLMIRGGSFYAIWDEERQIWSTDEFDVARLVDVKLKEYIQNRKEKNESYTFDMKSLTNYDTRMWTKYKTYLSQMIDTSIQLDQKLTFANTKTKKTDYVSKRLSYSLEEGSIIAYDELMSVLYIPEEREKLEWAIGAIVAGDIKHIQKFIVLYGDPGSGKSTFLNIVEKLFDGYYAIFEAKALTSSNNNFATESFKNDPLVAIQHDGDLSKIEDNTKLNSIISHEKMVINEKYKAEYSARMNCFMFLGTNKPVRITDSNSGIIRRLIDVQPSGNRISPKRYEVLTTQIGFELGAIAYHCLKVYESLGRNYYKNYKPLKMIFRTDVFFNFVEDSYHIFQKEDSVTLKQAYTMYKAYCDDALIEYKLPLHKFREELKSYFSTFLDRIRIDGKHIRSYYSGFLVEKFHQSDKESNDKLCSLVVDQDLSIIDDLFIGCPAQYATKDETPIDKWSNVKTKLRDIDTHKLHYIIPPTKHIVIDFDLKDNDGNKSLELNLEAASKWPTTYTELSKSGCAVHLHYIYDGDVSKLNNVYSEGIEIKTFSGKSALRRKLTKCNSSPVATINSGLPLKGEKKMLNFEVTKNEKGLRKIISKNLEKEYHPGTKPSIDFIFKVLDDAYKSGMIYDVTDMRPKIFTFASRSTNHADYCMKMVDKMNFASEEISEAGKEYEKEELIFFDVEVFPNLFIVCWKAEGKTPIKMINPKPSEIEELMRFKLIGFNCRRFDNHILYARYIGYDNLELYKLSKKIIDGSKSAMFGEAYNISYTDVYDFASAGNKMSLKKWEIKLGIHHQELGLPWDEEVPEELWNKVADYCVNDVIATEAVFNHLSGDWAARQILAELSGLSVNDTTNQHSIRIVFGKEKKPQTQFIYTNLSEMFPGYKFDSGVSTYRGIETGEGGYVYAEPGIYYNVAVLDVVSMHPTSIEVMDMFGPYTKNYSDLKSGRVAIKHKNYDILKTLLNGKLIPFIEDAMSDKPKFTLKDLSNGLKTALNSAYGLTSASFDNPFRDPRNIDNIVAKRGALFMIDLQHAVQEKGFTVAHIKTDSIKIPDATKEIINFIFDFGKKYGYEFEHEDTYERFCLVNDAVYIAKDQNHKWTATGAQFAHPYIFKTLFSKEPIIFEDMCETKSVTTELYLDMNETMDDKHNYHFIGKVGSFCPIKHGCGGGILLRKKDDKYYAVTGSKGYRWLEAEMVKALNKEDDIDICYYDDLADAAIKTISKFGKFESFVSDKKIQKSDPIGFDDPPPWCDKPEPPFSDEKCLGCSCYDHITRQCLNPPF